MDIKGTRTEQNLWNAFSGESMARNKYLFFADKARQEGYAEVAELFEPVSYTHLMNLSIPAIDAHTLGGLFYFFLFACYLSCKLLGVNPFNQPGVEGYKGYMFQNLGKPGVN